MTKKPTSKVDSAIALAQRNRGVSLKEIVGKLGVGSVASRSLVADARRKGAQLKLRSSRYYH